MKAFGKLAVLLSVLLAGCLSQDEELPPCPTEEDDALRCDERLCDDAVFNDRGPPGLKGDPGAEGPPGVKGDPMVEGRRGKRGKKGIKGEQVEQGSPRVNGEPMAERECAQCMKRFLTEDELHDGSFSRLFVNGGQYSRKYVCIRRCCKGTCGDRCEAGPVCKALKPFTVYENGAATLIVSWSEAGQFCNCGSIVDEKRRKAGSCQN